MKSNKSSGYNGVIIKIIQLASKEISLPPTHIFNLTFTTGTILDDLKIALVTPIFKGYDEKDLKTTKQYKLLILYWIIVYTKRKERKRDSRSHARHTSN